MEYEARNLIIENFAKVLKEDEEKSREDEVRVSLAYGMAAFVPNEDKNYQDVFNRADTEMYHKKKMMHAARTE